ncbi:MAG: 4-hydroxythreonine-4-phosphate dehydrogenase PdxA [Pseudomonadales bacterium]|nr:4-hydroxythreonine-4-phosphate dehydrogenase PdxA [Pseudomonadales bacterium]
MTNEKPRLAITMGDPAGVGAEIIVKAYALSDLYARSLPFVIGSVASIEQAMGQTSIFHPIVKISAPSDLSDEPGKIQVLEPLRFDVSSLEMGKVSASCGNAAVQYFETAVRLCLASQVHGVVTCPINKEAVHAAGYVGDIGHQEILARMTGAGLTATMLMTRGLKVAHLSTHKSLAEAVAYVKAPIIEEKLSLTHESLKSWGIASPRIAVAALNPHGGEGGMLGREEIEEITPAVERCRALGIDATGPLPADSVFYRAIRGEFDVVLALYHDQGHIAIKVHNFEESITATMGIPFIRTSVDHGTAFDIAGQNKADANGLVEALSAAISMLNQSLA